MWIVISLLAIALIWALAKKPSGKSATTSAQSSDIPRLRGNGRFAVEVVGESNYTSNFEAICGPRSRDGVDKQTRALLVLEHNNPHDRNAVRVSIEGMTVGYLSRSVALDFRRAIKSAGYSKHAIFDCAAIIRGGWDNGRGKRGHYGVWLDIPKDD